MKTRLLLLLIVIAVGCDKENDTTIPDKTTPNAQIAPKLKKLTFTSNFNSDDRTEYHFIYSGEQLTQLIRIEKPFGDTTTTIFENNRPISVESCAYYWYDDYFYENTDSSFISRFYYEDSLQNQVEYFFENNKLISIIDNQLGTIIKYDFIWESDNIIEQTSTHSGNYLFGYDDKINPLSGYFLSVRPSGLNHYHASKNNLNEFSDRSFEYTYNKYNQPENVKIGYLQDTTFIKYEYF